MKSEGRNGHRYACPNVQTPAVLNKHSPDFDYTKLVTAFKQIPLKMTGSLHTGQCIIDLTVL